jgi:hypothetical protein
MTKSNKQIAKLAIAQKTPWERFCVAARLYGGEDAADEAVAVLFRQIKGLRL